METMLLTSRKAPKSPVYETVSDSVADPVVNYLSYINDRQYERNLKERGLSQTNPLPDRGHTFTLQKKVLSGTLPSGTYLYQPHSYDGPSSISFSNVIPDARTSTGLSANIGIGAPSDSTAQLEAFGQRAFSRAAPKSSQFNLTRFAGELREGLPSMSFAAVNSLGKLISVLGHPAVARSNRKAGEVLKKLPSDVGGDTLNVMFGAVPLVSDVINLTRALVSLTEGLMSTDSFDRPVHRSYKEPAIITNTGPTTYESGNIYLPGGGQIAPASLFGISSPPTTTSFLGDLRVRTTYSKVTEVNRWFDGAFTRFLPSGYDGSRFLDRAHLLLQTDLDPKTLWNLTPWSWLVDWFVDVSTFLSAHQLGVDSLLFAHYAYAMEHTMVVETLEWELLPPSGYYTAVLTRSPRGVAYCRTDTKRRIRASPFGFQAGRTTGLSPYQSTVLGALALTKL
jgi:hypothetical protein